MRRNRDNARRQRAAPAVRFGGVRTPRGYLFELTGGHLCLDLANTVDERRGPAPRELLAGYGDLVDWGRQAGAITAPEARRLAARTRTHKAEAEQALSHARAAREAIFTLFSTIARKGKLSKAGLTELNRHLPRALAARQLAYRPRGPVWVWRADATPVLDRIVWPALASAADLLLSSDLSRVRECAGEGCGWLFLDRSRNRTRRWCDMTVCGNRAKVRRHRSRRH